LKVDSPHKQVLDVSTLPVTLPPSVDWRTQGVVTAVKDQGMCGSCWTFGTTETIESFYAIATGQLPVLSEEQILDCTSNPDDCGGVGGCGGGTGELAMAQIIEQGGIASEWVYPYTAYFGQTGVCHANTTGYNWTPYAMLSGYKVLPSNQAQPVMAAVASLGPLIINVDASSWGDYESGVYDGCDQSNPDLDHVVQLVGYGNDTNFGPYWLVRNSWAPSWGESGYIRLRRTEVPRCGNDTQPQDGTGCKGGPAEVLVCGTCGILYDVSYPVIDTSRVKKY